MKAYLAAHDKDDPFTHDLDDLLSECEKLDREFAQWRTLGNELTPYAVELRYDELIWPSLPDARRAWRQPSKSRRL